MRVLKRPRRSFRVDRQKTLRMWASVGTRLTFRAELMPGREPEERTFAVERVLSNNRVELTGLTGEHTEAEFETRR